MFIGALIVAIVVCTYLVAIIKENVLVEFWAGLGVVACCIYATADEISKGSSGWHIAADIVLLALWTWLAYESYKKLKKNDQEEAEADA